MPLTVIQIKNAKPKEKPYKLTNERRFISELNDNKLISLHQLQKQHHPITNSAPLTLSDTAKRKLH